MDVKFGTNVSDRMLMKAAKFQGYSFKPNCGRGWGVGGTTPPPPPPRLGLKNVSLDM